MQHNAKTGVEPAAVPWLSGGGEMGALMRALDWATTPVGPVDAWPQSLRTALGILLNSGYPMYIAWGADFTQFYNDAYRPILGATKHPEALGQSTPHTFPEIWEFIGPMFREVLAQGTASTYTDQLLALDRNGYAEECYFTFSYSAILHEAGGVGGVFVTVLETTERVLRERRLRTVRDLSTMPTHRGLPAICAAAAEILGHNPHDVPLALLYTHEPGHRPILAGRTGLAEGSPALAVLEGNDSGAHWLLPPWRGGVQRLQLPEPLPAAPSGPWPDPVTEAVCAPIVLVGQQQPAAFLVAGVSPRRAFDAEYEVFFRAVAANVATVMTEAEAYEHERRRAEALAEIDRAKTAFFSNVSHEFRTPLTLMVGPLEDVLATAGTLPIAAREQLTMVHRNSLRLLKLVNMLLDFSRIEAGRLQAVYEPTDLAAYTADLASVFRAAMERAGLTLRVHCPPLTQPVYVDHDMWEKIVLNLLSNALKFTFTGAIDVQLRETPDGVELCVRDTGVGIPAHELPRIFERFHRVEGTRGRTLEGTGIGLALVHELVKLHSGTVHVGSTLGQGTTFTVCLPLGTAHLLPDRLAAGRTLGTTALGAIPYVEEALRWLPDPDETAHTAHSLALVQAPGPPLQPAACQAPDAVHPRHASRPRVLLADDNADMREYLRRLLAGRYDVEAVPDGAAALAAARRQPPDLLLADVMMPGLDGFALLRAIRDDAPLRTLPVILLSARAGEESRLEGLEAGADDYLIKPFSARELLARVEAHLTLAQVRRDTQAALREQQQQLQAALAVGHIGIWRWDLATHTTTIDPTCRHILGLPDDLEGVAPSTFLDLVFPEDRQRLAAVIEGTIQEAAPIDVEYRIIRPSDGAVRWVYTRGGVPPRPPDSGGVITAATTDITASKQAQAELERRVEERTAALHYAIAERQQLEREAQRAEHFAMLGRLAAGVSHEIRNPLGAIALHVDLLTEELAQPAPDSPAAIAASLADIKTNLARLDDLVHDYLSLVRLHTIQPEVQDLGDAVQAWSAECQPMAAARGMRVQCESLASLGMVAFHASTLRRAVLNLVHNALDAMVPGGTVTLAGQGTAEQVQLQVRDTGSGIPAAQLAQIFEPLHTTKPGGVGLGLHIVQEVLAAHGGQVTVESAPGQGTTFTLTLPRQVAPPAATGP